MFSLLSFSTLDSEMCNWCSVWRSLSVSDNWSNVFVCSSLFSFAIFFLQNTFKRSQLGLMFGKIVERAIRLVGKSASLLCGRSRDRVPDQVNTLGLKKLRRMCCLWNYICKLLEIAVALFKRSHTSLLGILQLQLKEVHVVFFISKLWESIVKFLQSAAHIALFLKNKIKHKTTQDVLLNAKSARWKQKISTKKTFKFNQNGLSAPS